MPYKDHEKKKAYLDRYNAKRYSDPEWSHKQYLRVKARRERLAEWFRMKKAELHCGRCPEDEPYCLDFHHKDPKEKETTMARAIHYGWSIERIEKEIAKCEVLCANCHRKVHKPA